MAAVLPGSRSVQVNATATDFGTIINAGTTTATACKITPATSVPAVFHYQTTNAANQVTGAPDTPIDIQAGAARDSSSRSPPISHPSTDVQLTFDCTNGNPAPITTGLNTLLLSASASAVLDIVALAVTVTQDGIVNIPGASGTGVFSVASVNVGASAGITVSADTGAATLPISLTLCQTNPGTGACLASPSPTVTTTINAGATPTFGVFVTGAGNVPFDPAANRVFVRFKDAGQVIRGATSVAVRLNKGRATLTTLTLTFSLEEGEGTSSRAARARGSSRSLSASPTRFSASTITKIAVASLLGRPASESGILCRD